MFATIAAVLFGIALLLELLGTSIEGLITPTTLALLGLVFVAVHLAGYGTGWPRRSR
ncbi:hypothetical protein CLV63_10820 [Murinocardiopsis flavida]|uniref:Uncharacterized protein n=1 Tax=Murinocardiopsis flavida TaxID=645275 RepID=A0A2P8DJ93_9ACTN|nr:hypothetical protein [Murinocardiopsis flavida]PSK97302.1 hypothetical protein CLV63_10820 [Murinocardiopsis flavida]